MNVRVLTSVVVVIVVVVVVGDGIIYMHVVYSGQSIGRGDTRINFDATSGCHCSRGCCRRWHHLYACSMYRTEYRKREDQNKI